MSLWILHFQDGVAHVVVDTVAAAKPHPIADNEHPCGYTAKIRMLPQFGCALFGRGDSFFMSMLEMAINRLPILDFDDLCNNLVNVISVAEMMGSLYAEGGCAPDMSARQEVFAVGYSANKARIMAKFAVKDEDHPQYLTGMMDRGTYCMTTVPGVDGREDLRFDDIERMLSAIADRQLVEAFKIDSARDGNQAGGSKVWAIIAPGTIVLKSLGSHANATAIHDRVSQLPERRAVLHGV